MVAAGAWAGAQVEGRGAAGRARAGLQGELTYLWREGAVSGRVTAGRRRPHSCRAVGGARLAHLKAGRGQGVPMGTF